MKTVRFQTTFEFGEISPRLYARTDLPAYSKAVRKMENAVSLVHGGATKRRGTAFVGTLRNEAQHARLIPFIYSVEQKYMLVFNDGVVQFIRDGKFLETDGIRYELPHPYTEAELPFVKYAQAGAAMWLVHPAHPPQQLNRLDEKNWVFSTPSFEYNAVSGVTFSNAYITFKIINGSEVFKEGESFKITTNADGSIASFGQVPDPVSSNAARKDVVATTVGTNLDLTNAPKELGGRQLVFGDRILVKDQTNPAENGIYNAGSYAQVQFFGLPIEVEDPLTWSRAADLPTPQSQVGAIVRVLGYSDTGTYWKQTAPGKWERSSPGGNGRIVGVESMPQSSGARTWTITCILSTAQRQEWSVVPSDGVYSTSYWKPGNYPQTVSYFEQRLYFGGSPQWPQHIWATAAGDVGNLTVGNLDTDGIIVQIAASDYNKIEHLVSARALLPMTSSTEFSLAGPNNGAVSGISSNVIRAHTRNGSNYVRPFQIGREVIFIQRDGRKARAISYSVTEDANIAPDITIFAEHITQDGRITDAAFAQAPDALAWLVREDGVLLSLTLSRDFEVTAWARHTTEGKFENVACIPGEIADDVFMVVHRTVGGLIRRYVEQFDYAEYDEFYCDSTIYYAGEQTNELSGLAHLEGKTVTIVADGAVQTPRVVYDGKVKLDAMATKVWVGLPYTTTIDMLNPEFGDAVRTTQSSTIGIEDVTLRLQDTAVCQVNGKEVPFRKVGDLLNTAIEPYTGDMKIKQIGWTKERVEIVVTSKDPTPFTLLGVIINATVN